MKITLAAVLLLASTSVVACECVHDEFDVELARKSETAVLFRVLSTHVERNRGDFAYAEIEVEQVLRGDASGLHRGRYYIGWCCGIYVDAGGYYFGFGRVERGELELHAGNVLSLWNGAFNPQNPADEIEQVQMMLDGSADPPDFMLRWSSRHLYGSANAPVDCPQSPPSAAQ